MNYYIGLAYKALNEKSTGSNSLVLDVVKKVALKEEKEAIKEEKPK